MGGYGNCLGVFVDGVDYMTRRFGTLGISRDVIKSSTQFHCPVSFAFSSLYFRPSAEYIEVNC